MYGQNDEIKRMEEQLRRMKEDVAKQQQNCHHTFSETIYDPEKVTEQRYTGKMEGHGSDPYPVYESYETTKDRWSRTCTKCDYTQYAYKQKAVKYEPDFNN